MNGTNMSSPDILQDGIEQTLEEDTTDAWYEQSREEIEREDWREENESFKTYDRDTFSNGYNIWQQ
jgi:hypothetical protein